MYEEDEELEEQDNGEQVNALECALVLKVMIGDPRTFNARRFIGETITFV